MNQSTASCVNLRERCFVRLACVKHAASVHPEPGSNSHVKVCIAQKLAWLIILFDYCCFVRNELNRVLVSFLSNVLVRKIIFIIFQGCFTVQLSRFLQSVFRLESLIFPRKTDYFLCFRFVVSLLRQQILSYQINSCLSTLFLTFFILLFKVFVAPTSYILSNGSTFVNTFFNFLLFFLKTALLCICSRFKFLC